MNNFHWRSIKNNHYQKEDHKCNLSYLIFHFLIKVIKVFLVKRICHQKKKINRNFIKFVLSHLSDNSNEHSCNTNNHKHTFFEHIS